MRRTSVATATLVMFASIALLLANSVEPAFALDKKTLRKFIEEYSGADEKGKAKIQKRVKRASEKLVTKEVSKAIKKEASRESALDFAYDLKVPGLFKTAKKYIDTPQAAKVMKVLFVTTGDKKKDEFLLKEWKKAATENTDHFEILNAAFQKHWISGKVIELFYDELGDDEASGERKDQIREILKFQLQLTDEEASELPGGWKELHAEFKRRARPIPIKGKNLLIGFDPEAEFREFEGEDEEEEAGLPPEPPEEPDTTIVQYRDRFLLNEMGQLRIPKLNLTNFTVTLWVLPLGGEGQNLGVSMKGKGFVAAYNRGGIWGTTETLAAGTATCRNDWTEVKIVSRGGKTDLMINGAPVASAASANYGSVCDAIEVRAGTKGKILVGAIDLQK